MTRKPQKGLMIITASMHGLANFRKFISPVTLTLTLDRVKVISACTIPVVGTSQLVTWSTHHTVKSCDELTVVFHGLVTS